MPRIVFVLDYSISGGIGICQLQCYWIQKEEPGLEELEEDSD